MNKQIKVMALGTCCLVLGAVSADAAASEKRTTTDANGVTWNYTLRDGVAVLGWETSSTPATTAGGDLEIPPALDGHPVGVVGEYAFYNCKSVTSIVIPSSVTNVAEDAIYRGLTSLTNLVIPASVKTIGRYAFDFSDSKNVTVRIESLKAWCEAEREASYSSSYMSTSSPYDDSSNPFYYAKKRYFGDSELTYAGDFVIPEGVERINGGAFLGYLNVDGTWTWNNVTNIVFPSSLKEIGSFAFDDFTYLKTITIPPSVEKLGTCVFGTRQPDMVILPAGLPFIENLAAAFSGSSSLPTLQIDEANPNYVRSGNGLYSQDGTVFVLPVRPTKYPYDYSLKISDSVTRLAEKACLGASWIRSVTVPEGVTDITDGAFMRLSSMTNVVLGSQTKRIGRAAFYSCYYLTKIDLPDSVESIDESAFYYCQKLTDIRLPASLKTLGKEAFSSCRALKAVDLPESLESIGEYAFRQCEALTEIVVPDSVTNVSRSAFAYCKAMTNAVIGAGVPALGSYNYRDPVTRKYVYYSNYYPFMDCAALKSVTVRSANTALGRYVFQRCPSFERLSVPAGTVVDNDVFYSDSRPGSLTLALADGTESFDVNYLANAPVLKTLTTVLEIPPSCTTVDAAALNQLVNLTKVVFRGASFAAASNETLLNLRMNGLDVAYIPDGGTEADGEAVLRERLGNLSQVTITSSAVRESDAAVLDVQYVAAGVANRFTVRSLAFADGVRSFANVIRPTSFVDGTAANAYGDVTANEPHAISWKISDDWTVSLGHVAFEVMAVETAELPLRLVKIPATAGHAAMRFSCNALTSARVLDALFWHYADPNCGLTLADGRLYDGGTLLADGAEPTAAGTAYVFAKMGYRLLAGEELEYANSISRLGLVPEGARQYAVESPVQ